VLHQLFNYVVPSCIIEAFFAEWPLAGLVLALEVFVSAQFGMANKKVLTAQWYILWMEEILQHLGWLKP
jgi:hypothetical protein